MDVRSHPAVGSAGDSCGTPIHTCSLNSLLHTRLACCQADSRRCSGPNNALLAGLSCCVCLSVCLSAQALLDTVLVLAIVAVTGTLLFGLNVALADASQWWYSL